MTFRQAVVYFVREASLNLLRAWKISLLAVSTIAVSLYIGGCFLLVISNLSKVVEHWKREVKVVVYLETGLTTEATPTLLTALEGAPWVTDVTAVSAAVARQRFQTSFPSLGGLVQGWGEEPLPASFEVAFDPLLVESAAFDEWVVGLRVRSDVGMVDDDRAWLAQLEAVLRVLTGIGLTLGIVLVTAAIFTIASVIRLTAFLYREEINVMRMVGATELFVRGPFYMEGLIQGLLGGLLALAGLGATWHILGPSQGSVLMDVITADFMPPAQQLVIVLLGAIAGLMGAVISLRRETIGSA